MVWQTLSSPSTHFHQSNKLWNVCCIWLHQDTSRSHCHPLLEVHHLTPIPRHVRPINFHCQRSANCCLKPLNITRLAHQQNVIHMYVDKHLSIEISVTKNCWGSWKCFKFSLFTKLSNMLVPTQRRISLPRKTSFEKPVSVGTAGPLPDPHVEFSHRESPFEEPSKMRLSHQEL